MWYPYEDEALAVIMKSAKVCITFFFSSLKGSLNPFLLRLQFFAPFSHPPHQDISNSHFLFNIHFKFAMLLKFLLEFYRYKTHLPYIFSSLWRVTPFQSDINNYIDDDNDDKENSHNRKSLTGQNQDLNLARTRVQTSLNEVVE